MTPPDPPVNGHWSMWGSWGGCDGQEMVRTRVCDNPPPSGGGAQCPGSSIHAEDCVDPEARGNTWLQLTEMNMNYNVAWRADS